MNSFDKRLWTEIAITFSLALMIIVSVYLARRYHDDFRSDCMNAGGVRSLGWPQGLQSLIVFADNDASGVGQAAGRDLAGRAAAAGVEVRVLVPEAVGTDWLDTYMAGDAA